MSSEQIEIGVQKATRETVSRAELEKLDKQAPLLADILRKQGYEAYQKARPEYEQAYEAQQKKDAIAASVQKAKDYSEKYTPPPGVTDKYTVKKAESIPPPGVTEPYKKSQQLVLPKPNIEPEKQKGLTIEGGKKVLGEMLSTVKERFGTGEKARQTVRETPGAVKDFATSTYQKVTTNPYPYVVGAVETLVPGVYTAIHWKEMTRGEKIMHYTLDLAIVGGIAMSWLATAPYGAISRGGSRYSAKTLQDMAKGASKAEREALTSLQKQLTTAEAREVKQLLGTVKQSLASGQADDVISAARRLRQLPEATKGKISVKAADEWASKVEKSGIDTLKQQGKVYDDWLKRNPSSPKRALVEQLKELNKRQIRTLTKTKTAPVLEDMPEFPTGKFPLAKTTKTTALPKTVRAKVTKLSAVVVSGIKIPARELATKDIKDIAKERELTPAQIKKTTAKMAPERKSLFDDLVKFQQARMATVKVEPSTEARAETSPETQPLVKTMPITTTVTKPAQQTETLTRPLPGTTRATSTQPLPQPQPQPQPLAYPQPVKTPMPEKTPTRPGLLFPSKGATDKEKREYIKRNGVAVAQNMGKLGKKNPKDVWHVWTPDGKHLVVIGKKPEGAKISTDGPGSAKETTQVLGRGMLQRTIIHQHGAVRTRINPAAIPKGARASFTPVRGKGVYSRQPLYRTPQGGLTRRRR